MESKRSLVEQLKGMLTDGHVITDIEDRFVYSFEKVFKEPTYPVPDIVVKTFSQEEEVKVIGFAEKEGITLVKRGDQLSSFQTEPPDLLILLDNVEIPELPAGRGKRNISGGNVNKVAITFNNPLNVRKNRILALEDQFSSKTSAKCLQCSVCSDYCSVLSSFDGIETWSSKGRALLMRAMANEELTLSDKIVDILYTCTKCGLCFAGCFDDLDLQEAIVATRNKFAGQDMVPQVFHAAAQNILQHGDPSGDQIKRRQSWLKKVSSPELPEKADVLYWAGCTVASRNPSTAKAFFNVLNETNTDFTMLGEKEGCCGYVLHSAGLWDEATAVAKDTVSRIEKIGAEYLVTPCAGCYYTFTKLYPEVFGVSMPVKVLHSSQYIEKLVGTGEITFKPVDTAVTYHDPCSLGRHSKVYEAPRNVLKAIPGLELIEIPFNKDLARCCGGGGGLWSFNHEISMDEARTRLKRDASTVDVDALVTACPQCQMNFRLTARKNALKVKICDITEIVESAMNTERS